MERSNLNSDLIFEILTRTSLKGLDRCKSVCKGWKNLTYESTFTPLHCERTGTILGYFVQDLVHNKYFSKFASMDRSKELGQNLSLDFLPHPMKVEASSNQGILCCVYHDYRNYRFYVCKPSTRQWQKLPNPKTRYMTVQVAIVVIRSNPLHYKIVRLSNPKHMLKYYYNYHCEIFDSDLWAWRKLNDVLLPPRVIFINQPTVVASGAIHWLTSNDQVFAFDINSETYSTFPLPEPIITEEDEFHYRDKQLTVYKGRLAFIYREPDGYLVLWEMDTNRVWQKINTLNIEPVEEKEHYPSYAAFYNADTAVMKGFRNIMFYKFQNCGSGDVKLHDLKMVPRDIFVFRSDLEPTELKCGS
ncbi:hypothetical protein CsSME_00050769 [Camellia sinensis var. sinensis]